MTYKKAFYLSAVLILSFSVTSILLAVSRGSGSYTSRLRLYSPAQYEDPGWGTDTSTNSIQVNNTIIDSRVSSLELVGDNTNYVNLTGSTQTKSGGLILTGSLGIATNTISLDSSAVGIQIGRRNSGDIQLKMGGVASNNVNITGYPVGGDMYFNSVQNSLRMGATSLNSWDLILTIAGKIGIGRNFSNPVGLFQVLPGTSAFSVNSEGLVSIGTDTANLSSGGKGLHVHRGSSGDVEIKASGEANSNVYFTGAPVGADMYINNVGAGSLYIGKGGLNDTDLTLTGTLFGVGITSPAAQLHVSGEVRFTGISSDGSGKAVCVKANGDLGTCSDAVGAGGTCTCG